MMQSFLSFLSATLMHESRMSAKKETKERERGGRSSEAGVGNSRADVGGILSGVQD